MERALATHEIADRLAAPLAGDILRLIADHTGCAVEDLEGLPVAPAARDLARQWIRVWVHPESERITPVVDAEAVEIAIRIFKLPQTNGVFEK